MRTGVLVRNAGHALVLLLVRVVADDGSWADPEFSIPDGCVVSLGLCCTGQGPAFVFVSIMQLPHSYQDLANLASACYLRALPSCSMLLNMQHTWPAASSTLQIRLPTC